MIAEFYHQCPQTMLHLTGFQISWSMPEPLLKVGFSLFQYLDSPGIEPTVVGRRNQPSDPTPKNAPYISDDSNQMLFVDNPA
jgi:hypothetical protein